MAGARRESIQIEIGAEDNASKVIDKVASRIDGLQSDEARVIVSATIDKLDAQLDRARAKLATLSGDEATVQARLVGTLETDLEQAKDLFDQLDGQTGTVTMTSKGTAEVEKDLRGVDDALSQIQQRADSVSPAIGKLFAGLASSGGAAAVGAVAIGAGLVLAAQGAAEAGNEVAALQNLIGGTTEEVSGLRTVWMQSGADVKDLSDVVLQMNGVLATTPALAEQLGINLSDGATGAERMAQVISALNTQITDVSQRGVLGSQIFGEEGVRQVNQLVTLVGTDLHQAIADLPEGAVLSDDDIANAREMKKQTAEMQLQFQAMTTELGTAFLPLMLMVADVAGRISTVLSDGMQGAADLGTALGHALSPWNNDERAANNKITEEFEAGRRAADEMFFSITNGATSIEEVRDRAAEAGLSLDGINAVTVEWARNQGIATSAVQGTTEAMTDAETVARSLKQGIAETFSTDPIDEFRARLDIDDKFDNLQTDLDELRWKFVEAWVAGVDGADDFRTKSDEAKSGLRDVAGEVLTLAESLDEATPERIAEITLAYEQGDIDALQAQYDDLARTRTTTFVIKSIGGSRVGSQVPPMVAAPDEPQAAATLMSFAPEAVTASQPIVNITNVTIPSADPSALVRSLTTWSRNNGNTITTKGR